MVQSYACSEIWCTTAVQHESHSREFHEAVTKCRRPSEAHGNAQRHAHPRRTEESRPLFRCGESDLQQVQDDKGAEIEIRETLRRVHGRAEVAAWKGPAHLEGAVVPDPGTVLALRSREPEQQAVAFESHSRRNPIASGPSPKPAGGWMDNDPRWPPLLIVTKHELGPARAEIDAEVVSGDRHSAFVRTVKRAHAPRGSVHDT
jgi:hypothetical protein